MNQNRQRGRELGIMLLAYQLAMFGLDKIPPVTLTLISGMAAIYLGFVPALDPYYHTQSLCVNAVRIAYGGEWHRLIAPVLMHGSDMHLYYNMVSLMWKGHRLERRVGSLYFAYLIAVFTILCNITMVALSVIGDDYLHLNWGLKHECAIGFSGVLFALKVLCNHYFTSHSQYLMGIPIPVSSRWAAWAELVLIQVLMPHASFIGHLAGILVGVAYVNTPLTNVIDSFIAPAQSFVVDGDGHGRHYQRSGRAPDRPNYGWNVPNQGRSIGRSTWYKPWSWWSSSHHTYRQPYTTDVADGSYSRWHPYYYWPSDSSSTSSNFRQPSDYSRYTAGLTEEEQLREAMQRSLNQQGSLKH